jgi:hypothetical protein
MEPIEQRFRRRTANSNATFPANIRTESNGARRKLTRRYTCYVLVDRQCTIQGQVRVSHPASEGMVSQRFSQGVLSSSIILIVQSVAPSIT